MLAQAEARTTSKLDPQPMEQRQHPMLLVRPPMELRFKAEATHTNIIHLIHRDNRKIALTEKLDLILNIIPTFNFR